jgi:hypothetical protein
VFTKKLSSKNKQIILYLTSAIRIIGVGTFLVIHPFLAYLINAFLDMADGPIHKHILKIDPPKAQLIDKILDLWLYTTAIFTIFNIFLLIFYLYRLAGQIVYFISRNKRLLVYFPNFFENFFLFFTLLDLISANYLLEKPLFMYPSVILLIMGKIAHEVSLHRRNETVFDNIILPLFKASR